MSERISLIIPTYNRAHLIGSALESIFTQSHRPHEIIVVNDGSKDDTVRVVQSYGDAVELVSKDNGGKSSALNLGLQYATGDYIWIFDDDDIAAPDGLRQLFQALHADPKAGFSFGGYRQFSDERAIADALAAAEPERSGPVIVDEFGCYLSLMIHNQIMQPGMLVRRSSYDTVGPFDETFVRSQDYEMLLRLARRFRGTFIDQVVFYQRQHAGLRGSGTTQVKAEHVETVWKAYDRIIFTKIFETHDLAEFLPEKAADALSSERLFTAHLLRGSVMARKHLWREAVADYRSAFAIGAEASKDTLTELERKVLRRVFDVTNLLPTDVLNAPEFPAVVRSVTNQRLREEIRSALLYPLPHLLRRALQRGQRGRLISLLHVCVLLGSPSVFLRNIIDKLVEKQALPVGLLKRRPVSA